ncbi:hypothetical protein [Streptomyces sp. NBC_01396]
MIRSMLACCALMRLSGDEAALLRNKIRATRIGFAAMLKFVQ